MERERRRDERDGENLRYSDSDEIAHMRAARKDTSSMHMHFTAALPFFLSHSPPRDTVTEEQTTLEQQSCRRSGKAWNMKLKMKIEPEDEDGAEDEAYADADAGAGAGERRKEAEALFFPTGRESIREIRVRSTMMRMLASVQRCEHWTTAHGWSPSSC